MTLENPHVQSEISNGGFSIVMLVFWEGNILEDFFQYLVSPSPDKDAAESTGSARHLFECPGTIGRCRLTYGKRHEI